MRTFMQHSAHPSAHPTGRRRSTRLIGATVATVMTAGLLAVLPASPAQAAGNSLYFPNGSDHVDVGANAALFIDGTITFDAACTYGGGKGIDDFVYPATDVYIVEAGSATDGATLKDAAGETPNTIVGTGSGAFIGELIGVVTPTGRLGEGVFDVVYDTCQNGTVDEGDEIFYDAITVDVPDGQLPPVDSSMRQLKARAAEEYAAWLRTHIGLTALFKFEDAKNIAECILSAGLGCLVDVLLGIYDLDSVMAQSSDWIENQTLNLVANRAANYGAIWQDPPDSDFSKLPRVVPEQVELPASSGQPIADAMAGLTEPLAQEGALAGELLHALERYQGAQAAGDEEWALVQARAVRDLSAALGDHLASSTAVVDLRTALAADIDGVEARADEGADAINRIRDDGLAASERRALRNAGLTEAQVRELEDDFVAQGRAYAPKGEQILANFDALVSAQQGMREALVGSTDGWDTLVTSLEERVDEVHPEADAGGPYNATGNGAVTLDASASKAAPGAAKLAATAWDLDNDGQYDDAEGPVVDATVESSRTVAVKVTDDLGRSAVDLAYVEVRDGDRAPVVTDAAPGTAVRMRTGATETFSVEAEDPDGGALTYRWSVGDEVVAGATGASFDYSPGQGTGHRMVSVVVSRGGRSAAHSWVVGVLGPDADGDGWSTGPDCDDARADRHPGAFERLGNGMDDDCDATTDDAPPGGLTGSVWSWGSATGVGLPARPNQDIPYNSPVPVPSLGTSVRAVETASAAGYAVLDDGTVRSWGTNFSGRLGDGTQDKRFTPVTVKNVDGEDGSLGGVVSVAAEGENTLALRANGSVVAWGANGNLQLGDGTTVGSRLAPVRVRTEDGSPLTGAAQVENGEMSSYAVMADGTVRNWGVVRCDGVPGDTTTKSNLAVVNERYGSGVVQVASGDGGGALVRKADGSLWSCGGYDDVLGRPSTIYTKDQLHPVVGLGKGVVDVSMGGAVAVALTEDGKVWTWGRNLNNVLGVLGLEQGARQVTPAAVPLPEGPPVIDVDVDYGYTVHALRADGSVLVWGSNPYGAGGAGTSDVHLTGIKAIDLGGNRAIATASSVWNGLALVRPADEPTWDRPAQWVSASVSDTEVGEAAGGSAQLTLSEDAPDELSVTYVVGDGPQRTATVAKGARTAQLPVSVEDDALDEDDEALPLQVVSVSHGVQVSGGAAVVTVLDDDVAPAVSIAGAQLDEGDTSLTDVPLTVSLSAASGKDVEVTWATADDSATSPGDYTEATGHVTIPAGQKKATVHVAVVGDTDVEPDESFRVGLADPVNATLGAAQATVSLHDDEPLVLSVESPDVAEGDQGTTPATFTVSIAALAPGESVTVPWSVKAGTAEKGSDVIEAEGELTLDADHRSREVTVEVVGDRTVEQLRTETFGLAIGDVVAGAGRVVVRTDAAAATINDDDTGPGADAGADVEGDEGSPVAISGSANAPATWSVDKAGCTVADPTALVTTVTCADEVTATLTLTADDGTNPAVTDTAALTVRNAAPTVTITAPTGGAQVTKGQPVQVVATVADAGADDVIACSVDWADQSAGATECTASHTFTAAGTYAVTVTARDGDGGEGRATVSVKVVDPAPAPGWPFQGFFAPVQNVPAVNVVDAGSTVPLSFSLGANRGTKIFATGYPKSAAHSCGSGATINGTTATPTTGKLTYDAKSGRYTYAWTTDKTWQGTCRTVTVTFTDGTEKTAELSFPGPTGGDCHHHHHHGDHPGHHHGHCHGHGHDHHDHDPAPKPAPAPKPTPAPGKGKGH